MNIHIFCLGTRGDVQPFVALGEGLQARGHTVTLSTSSSFEPLITAHGMQYGYMNNDLIDLVNSEEGREMLESLSGFFSWFKVAQKWVKLARNMQRKYLNECWESVQQSKPDLIIYNSEAYWSPHFSKLLQIPCIYAMELPLHVPTKAYPCVLFPDFKIGWLNKLTHTLFLKVTESFLKKYAKIWRDETDLPDPPKKIELMKNGKGEPVPTLFGYSEHILPKPSDLKDHVSVTGYWFVDERSQYQPPDELVKFLAAGDPPVYVGFGSMAAKHPERLTKIVIDALQLANVRGIAATGWGGLAPEDLPDTIFKIDNAPHDWLFPKMAAIVHHGGAGTTGASLLAGKPMVICPFLVDQPFWGKKAYQLGVGCKPVPQKSLTAEKLADAIREVTTSQTMKRNAEALGKKIQTEDGVGKAIDIIEKVVYKN